jgi:hypothetical protein
LKKLKTTCLDSREALAKNLSTLNRRLSRLSRQAYSSRACPNTVRKVPSARVRICTILGIVFLVKARARYGADFKACNQPVHAIDNDVEAFILSRIVVFHSFTFYR